MHRVPAHAGHRVLERFENVRDGTWVRMLVKEFKATTADHWALVR
jgi:hypothetical protein